MRTNLRSIGTAVPSIKGLKQLLIVISFLFASFYSKAQVFTEYFNGNNFPNTWSAIKTGNGNNWTVSVGNNHAGTGSNGNSSMVYSYNGYAANAWAFTAGITLTAGKHYRVEFFQKVGSASYSENLKVTVGTAQTITSQNNTLLTLNNLTNITYTQRNTDDFRPATTGTYYFAFNCFSAANKRQLYVDYIKVTELAPVISLTSLPSVFYSASGFPSLQQAYTVTGNYITDEITVTAPAGFEISKTSGISFRSESPVSLTTSNGDVNTQIFVRSKSSSSSVFSGTLNHTCDATSVNTTLNGSNAACTPLTKTLNVLSGVVNWLGLSWLGGAPTPCDNAIINLNAEAVWGSVTTLNLTAPIVVNNLTINGNSLGIFGNQIELQTNGFPLFIKGDLIIETTTGSFASTSTVSLKATGGSSITVLGNVILTGNYSSFWGFEYGNKAEIIGSGEELDLTVYGNVTVNKYASISNTNLLLDKSGAQSLTNNSDDLLNLESLTIGGNNSPVVTLSGNTPSNKRKFLLTGGDLILNNNSTLNLPAGVSLGQATATAAGSFIMNGTSKMNVSDNTGTFTNGSVTYTGITGSNFPARFQNYTLSNTSTVEYNGTAQNIFQAEYGNLTLSNTGMKTAPPVLKIKGNFTNSGSVFNHNNGLVELTGTAQSFAGVDYNSLELKGGNTKTTNGLMSIKDSLKIFNNTTLALRANDTITLSSNINKTASFAKMEAGALVTYGTNAAFTVERYIPQHTKAWQHLAVPAKGQTIKSAWQEGAVTANGNNKPGYGAMLTSNLPNAVAGLGFDAYTPAGPTIKIYQPGTGTYVSPASASSAIANKEGYLVLVRGDRSVTTSTQAATPTTMRTSGKLYTNGADAPQATTVPAGKFASVANPYASAVSFSKLVRTGDIQDVFYIWDPRLTGSYGLGAFQTFISNGSGGYNTVVPGGSYASGNTNIESGMGFFIKSPVSGGTISFNENAKASGSNIVNRPGGLSDQLRINLNVISDNAPLTVDAALVQYDELYDNNIDDMDVRKLGNSGENISIVNNGLELTAERRNRILPSDTVFIKISSMRYNNYSFDITGQDLGDPMLTAILEDTYLNTETALDLDNSTNINFSITSDAGSYRSDRFRVIFRSAAIALPVNFTTVSAIRINAKQVNVSWKSENEYNMESYTIERSSNGQNFTAVGSVAPEDNNYGDLSYNFSDLNATGEAWFYRVRGNSIGGRQQFSAVVKVASVNDIQSLNVFPNPVENKTIQLHYTKIATGNYSVILYNKMGQEIFNSVITINGTGAISINLPVSLNTGSYNMILKGNNINFKQNLILL